MMNSTSTLTPNSEMFALPLASPFAFRSPCALDSGRPGIVPSMAIAKCTVCTVDIAASDCCIRVGPGGSAVVDVSAFLLEQAAVVRASAAVTATTTIPRVRRRARPRPPDRTKPDGPGGMATLVAWGAGVSDCAEKRLPDIGAWYRCVAHTVAADVAGYLICMPEIARATTRRWISDVPSKIV